MATNVHSIATVTEREETNPSATFPSTGPDTPRASPSGGRSSLDTDARNASDPEERASQIEGRASAPPIEPPIPATSETSPPIPTADAVEMVPPLPNIEYAKADGKNDEQRSEAVPRVQIHAQLRKTLALLRTVLEALRERRATLQDVQYLEETIENCLTRFRVWSMDIFQYDRPEIFGSENVNAEPIPDVLENAHQSFTRLIHLLAELNANFIAITPRSIGPLLIQKFPEWKDSIAETSSSILTEGPKVVLALQKLVKSYQEKSNRNRPKSRRARVLSLDGGGVRSFASLLILKDLMRHLNELRSQGAKNSTEPLRPTDVFDYMYGSSSGGLIAIMLGRLGMTVESAISNYIQYADRIFSSPKRSLFVGITRTRYSEKNLVHATRLLVGDFDPSPPHDRWRRDIFRSSDTKTKVGVTTFDTTTNKAYLLRSYSTPDEGSFDTDTLKVWEAAWATSAAPFYFPPMPYKDKTFIDGAISANNPSLTAFREVLEHTQHREMIFVSIGSGGSISRLPRKSGFDVLGIAAYLNTLASLVMDTEATARMVEGVIDRSQQDYFRLNPIAMGVRSLGEWKTSWKGKEKYFDTLELVKLRTADFLRKAEVQKELAVCAKCLLKALQGKDETECKMPADEGRS
ncbi:FabD/lysophospholipase-like protein [Lindgomyces ingoldianus]|uniref:FabD/lysophospholipase-like protein n=1 Tax=Lindgomyces ingoldianus TaxID=673940 RepID=A0ACB6Q955_9PLEO|nr:FabD/lysophospholipase-like protein [Lindgomyces ingoldianus]KAF2463434.1 FabD/lysophospholipase-like protein [Lindgomyces ingoldianus]